jgi:hypothetical protein
MTTLFSLNSLLDHVFLLAFGASGLPLTPFKSI